MKNLFIDFDGTIVNTIKAICDLYNKDFAFYDDYKFINWSDIETWNFDELKLASSKYINQYFNQPRFFDVVEFMPFAKEIIDELSSIYKIHIVSMGDKANLRLKEQWIKNNISYAEFIGVDFAENADKSKIDFTNGILIDDSIANLKTSNATINICFGDEYDWNKDWSSFRCYNWIDVKRLLNNNKY